MSIFSDNAEGVDEQIKQSREYYKGLPMV